MVYEIVQTIVVIHNLDITPALFDKHVLIKRVKLTWRYQCIRLFLNYSFLFVMITVRDIRSDKNKYAC